jgi:thiamine kinase-like enzyme
MIYENTFHLESYWYKKILFISFVFLLNLTNFSSEAAMFSEEEQELTTLGQVLHSYNTSPTLLVEKLESLKYRPLILDKSCSGNMVIKVHKFKPYIIKILESTPAFESSEITCTREASKITIAPKLLISHSGINKSYMLMEYLETSPLSDQMDWLSINWQLMEPIITSIKVMHNNKELTFPPVRTSLELVRDYFHLIDDYKLPAPTYLSIFRKYFEELLLLITRKNHYVPCHFDLHGDNIFISEDKVVKLIDWDCAGTGNKYLELAALSLKFHFSDEEDQKLLDIYFGLQNEPLCKAYFYLTKLIFMGFYSVREFVRPYFFIYPPYERLQEVRLEDHSRMSSLSKNNYSDYELIVLRARSHESVNLDDMEIGILLLQESIRRATTEEYLTYKNYIKGQCLSSTGLLLSNYRLLKVYWKNLIFTLYSRGSIQEFSKSDLAQLKREIVVGLLLKREFLGGL